MNQLSSINRGAGMFFASCYQDGGHSMRRWKLTCAGADGDWPFVLEEMEMEQMRILDIRRIEQNVVEFESSAPYSQLLVQLDRCTYGSDYELEEVDI